MEQIIKSIDNAVRIREDELEMIRAGEVYANYSGEEVHKLIVKLRREIVRLQGAKYVLEGN